MNKPGKTQMKKVATALLAAVCALSLMGCRAVNDMTATQSPTMGTSPSPQALNSASPTTGSEYKDGTYTAQSSDAYAEKMQGWREYVTLTIQNGQITDVEYDAEKDGKKKSETTPDEYPMDPHPSQWIPQLEENLKMAADVADIDSVTGATMSSQMVKKLYAAALNAARTGDTQVVTVADDMTTEQESTNPQTTNQEGGQE